VKHDGKHKARIVAGGHSTETVVDSVFSGVVTLSGIWIITFLAEHHNLELWGINIGNTSTNPFELEHAPIHSVVAVRRV
jgi:hypothetical protein